MITYLIQIFLALLNNHLGFVKVGFFPVMPSEYAWFLLSKDVVVHYLEHRV